ncbi:MAG TPA: 16S rRNA (cytosine(1402)-N(4))-methyltransferase, partial [Candidatus Paceibacterota bacterium]|nr:16S rRNA (cytosine(1402)-N(4))-methyltransferase [Candidatus Paceibacterota bacterium]
METRHETVLLQESVDALSVVPGDVVVDATLGGAGHFMALARALGKDG